MRISIEGSHEELAPIFSLLAAGGQTTEAQEGSDAEAGKKKRRAKAEIEADAKATTVQPEALPAPPVTPPPAITGFETTTAGTGKVYTVEEIRAKTNPKVKELGGPKMLEVLAAFNVKSIDQLTPDQQNLLMNNIDSYTATSVAADHFKAASATVADEDFPF